MPSRGDRRGVSSGAAGRLSCAMLKDLLSQYGYLALFAGCLLEGETLLLLAGLAAHQGYLSLPLVMGVAFVGGTLGDQIGFFIGRRYGNSLLGRWKRLDAQAERVRLLIDRHAAPLIVGVRFMYGLRLVGPVLIGMSDVTASRFVVFNLIGAALWAVGVSSVGYFFGHAIQWLIADLERLEQVALVCVVVVVAGLLVLRRRRERRNEAKP
jgi:membrane protein DedA with SNARE-associated domain